MIKSEGCYVISFFTKFCRVLADKVWELANLDFPAHLSEELMPDIEHPVECVQSAAARALAALLEDHQQQVQDTLDKLLSLYKDRLEVCFFFNTTSLEV